MKNLILPLVGISIAAGAVFLIADQKLEAEYGDRETYLELRETCRGQVERAGSAGVVADLIVDGCASNAQSNLTSPLWHIRQALGLQ